MRPTLVVLDQLNIDRPRIGLPLHRLDHPLVAKSQTIPDQVEAGQATRIKKLSNRMWYRVKHEARRGGATRLLDADDWIRLATDHERYRWWLCLCGFRSEDSPQRNFYDQISDASAKKCLPSADDRDRILAEIAAEYVDKVQEKVRRSAYESLQSNRYVPLDYGDEKRIVTAIRAFPSNETYMSISASVNNQDDFIVALGAFEGIEPQEWLPEHDQPVDILGNTDGEIVYSAMITPEAQAALLNEGDIKGWPKGWN